ncbi:MAG TPA: hypothetical protein VFB80_03380 [Pirellulaceae bacterium]|nr:hypothetical protein [Pirellulaceae bacterium]
MKRKLLALGLVLAAGTLLASGGHTILIDDFNDRDSEGWVETDFTGGRGSFSAHTRSYVLKTGPIAVDDPSVGTLDADWEPSEDNPLYANGTLRARIRANTYGTTVGLLMRDTHELEADYGFYGSTSFGTFYIEYFNFSENPDAPQTILAMADPEEFPFEADVDYILEARVVGDKLSLKAWREGDSEPSEPMLVVKDNRLTADVATGLATIAFFDPAPLIEQGVERVRVNATVDDITFTPQGH